MAIEIRPVRVHEYAAAEAVISEAFAEPKIADMVRAIRESEFYWHDLELVALDGDEVVGQVMVSGATLRYDTGERMIPMLSPLATLPTHQQRGIATGLIREVLEATDASGEPLVILEGSPDFYGRRGFSSAQDAGVSIPIPDWAPPEAAQIARLTAYDSADPTLRGQVVYPPAVTALDL